MSSGGAGDHSEQGKSIHVMSGSAAGHVDKQAELGFTTGGDMYDLYRPSYSDESVDLIVSEVLHLSTPPSKDGLKYYLLELGAGTGKMTEMLSKKLPEYAKYLATDMSENFLDVLKGKGLSVDVAVATADNIPLEDESVGSVVCAQSFHWFSDKKNLESIHRVLVPGGKLILVWNFADLDNEWFAELRQKMQLRARGYFIHDLHSMEWQKDINESPLFKLQWYKTVPGVKFKGNLDTVKSSLSTSSFFKALPPEERESYLTQILDAVKKRPGFDYNNINVPYKTDLYVYDAQ